MVLAFRFSTRVTSGASGLAFELETLDEYCSGEEEAQFCGLVDEPEEEWPTCH
jgi:hypothetical protein